MDKNQFYHIFADVFKKNNLQIYVKDEIVEKFFLLTELMLQTNTVMNITALTTLEKIIPLHYADCVIPASYVKEGAAVLDVGCGGGFPILPLAIVRPDLHLTGLDSTEKKIRYVQSTANELGLPIQTIHGRAEEIAHDWIHRETYDVVISRAVARLNMLNELCLPFLKPGGTFWAMKGAAGKEEQTEAADGCPKLGGKMGPYIEYPLHLLDGSEQRTMICIDKIAHTPPTYPRSFGAIKKKPLS